MTRAQFAVTLVVVAVTGLLGGTLSDRLRSQPAWAQEGAAGAKVLEAGGFRLVDDAGKLRAWVAIDAEGRPGIAFLDGDGLKVWRRP
jgi:cytochrome oxidase Cu insertion factor (SCO1/SenC/PrrC family)